MTEPASNIRHVCEKHGIKPDPKFAKKPPASFVGHYVKKGFKTKRPDEGYGPLEHMWVKVLRVDEKTLIGVLDNDPIHNTGLKCGDEVRVSLSEIEDFLE